MPHLAVGRIQEHVSYPGIHQTLSDIGRASFKIGHFVEYAWLQIRIHGLVVLDSALNRPGMRLASRLGMDIPRGPRPLDIFHIVLQRGMTPVVLRLRASIAGICALGPLLRSTPYEMNPSNPLTIAAVVTAIFLAAIAACHLPGRRAAKIDPMEALRYE